MGVNRTYTQNIFGFGFWVGYKYFQVLGLGIYISDPKPNFFVYKRLGVKNFKHLLIFIPKFIELNS
jgi:hypothetical protein